MITKIIEGYNVDREGNPFNHGKFMVGIWDLADIRRKSYIPGLTPDMVNVPLLRGCGIHPFSIWVLDIQTGEGALFVPHGYAKADLGKHKVWVCVLFEAFLEWLYESTKDSKLAQETWLAELPTSVQLDAPSALAGYRRPGPPVQ